MDSLATLNLQCEFVLIDDASEPADGIQQVFKDFRSAVKNKRHRFKIARAKKHLHYTGVFSLGIHLSEQEKIFFLSNDMVITPHFFTAVLAVSALKRDYGIVRGTSNYCDSHPEHTVIPPSDLHSYVDVANFSRAIFESKGLTVVEDSMLSGDAVLISRSLVDRIGVLDLRFFGYFGDVDFGMRAHLAGFKLVCAKGAWLWHKGVGHVIADALKKKQALSIAHAERKKLVETAYQVFRQKWDQSLPSTYDYQPRSLHLFPVAEKNRNRIDLNYEYPAEESSTYELV
jgi:GT2 family glycosyltransferase